MKKGVSFIWKEECQRVFDDIKRYLMSPPVLVPLISGISFLMYVQAMDHSLEALLA